MHLKQLRGNRLLHRGLVAVLILAALVPLLGFPCRPCEALPTRLDDPPPTQVSPAVVNHITPDGLELRWTQAEAGILRFEVYRNTAPYFSPEDSCMLPDGIVGAPGLGSEAFYLDEDAFDAPLTSYYYIVLAVRAGELKSPVQPREGAFHFDLTSGGIWKPNLNASWHWLIDHPLDLNNAKDMGLVDPAGNPLSAPAPEIYDIDGFFNGQDPNCNIRDEAGACVQGENDAVAQLHAMGKRVICYIDVGVYEDYRPDAYKFPASVIGSPDEGWDGSYWLDIRRTDILGPIMAARMKMCKDKGFDAIEPDEIDGYSNDTEFGLTYADQIRYNIFIAEMAHGMGMSIGLKGDIDQVADLVEYFDWTLNEECFQYRECDLLRPFSDAGKAVFQVEYRGTTASFCPAANANNWNSMRMPLALDGGRIPCR
jgi:hypothetical protein